MSMTDLIDDLADGALADLAAAVVLPAVRALYAWLVRTGLAVEVA
jgi:hypothetical protein